MRLEKESSLPLSGLGILDLADEKADFCSRLLADWGARVIKIERPGGDPSRKAGPFSEDFLHPEKSLTFRYNNGNKLGITLDIEHNRGKKIFSDLVRRNDVVVESYMPGYLEGIGLGFSELKKINKEIIIISISGFGQKGPRKGFKTCDLVASAFGGQMYVSGSSSGTPLKPFGEQSYYSASLFGAIGLLLALRRRRKMGEGEHIDVSMQEAVASTIENVMPRYFFDHVISKRQGALNRNTGFCILPCRNGFVQLTVFEQWDTLVEWMESEGMAGDLKDDKWKDQKFRLRHLDHITDVLAQWTRTHTSSELFKTGQLMRFSWAPVCSLSEVLNSPQLRERGFFAEMREPGSNRSLKFPTQPFRFSTLLPRKMKAAPRIGEDNETIFHKELEIGAEELAELSTLGVT